MNSNHTNQTTEKSPEDRLPACRDALRAFWKAVHEEMCEAFDSAPDGKVIEVHIKPFPGLILAAIWEDGIGMTLFGSDWEPMDEDFSPPNYMDREQVQWIVEIAARHGIRHEPKTKPAA